MRFELTTITLARWGSTTELRSLFLKNEAPLLESAGCLQAQKNEFFSIIRSVFQNQYFHMHLKGNAASRSPSLRRFLIFSRF